MFAPTNIVRNPIDGFVRSAKWKKYIITPKFTQIISSIMIILSNNFKNVIFRAYRTLCN